jgi:hypothetical protein
MRRKLVHLQFPHLLTLQAKSHFLRAHTRRFSTKSIKGVLMVFFLVLLLQSTNGLFAQRPPENSTPRINWSLNATVNNVKFYHAIVDCNGKKMVFLKFDNKNSYPVDVTWKEVFATQLEEKADGYAGKKQLTLQKGVTMPVNCADNLNKKNIISSSEVSPTYVVEIRKFDYKEISVSKAK